MAALNETRNAIAYEAAGITSQGLLLKHSTDGLLLADAKGDEVCGVSAAESSRDANSALIDGTAASSTVAVYPLSGIVYIKFGEALSTLDFGAKIYVDDSVDGHCTHNLDSSGKHLGYYFGESNISLASGDLIPVACGRWS